MPIEPMTDAERERFAGLLENDVASLDAIIEQMKKISAPDAMVRQYTTERGAMIIVARMLRSKQSQTV